MTTLSSPPIQLMSNAVLQFFRDAGLRVGDHELPTDRTTPYSILYVVEDAPVPDQPELVATPTDLWLGVQLTSIGSRRDQAQLQADRVRRRLLDTDSVTGAFVHDLPAIAGWVWNARIGAAPSGVVPEGTAPNKLYNVPDRYTLHVTPA